MKPFSVSVFCLLGLASATSAYDFGGSAGLGRPRLHLPQRPSFFDDAEDDAAAAADVDPRAQLRQFQRRRRRQEQLERGGRQAPPGAGFRDFGFGANNDDGATYDDNGRRTNRYNADAPYERLREQQRPQRPQYDNFDDFNGYEAQRRRDPVFRPFQEEREEEVEVVKVQAQRPRRPVFKKPVVQEQRPQERVDEVERRQVKDQDSEPQTNTAYRPASGPAYATALNMDQYNQMKAQARLDFGDLDYAKHGGGEDAPVEQRDIEAAVFAGANAHKPDGVFQTENRIDFQINGHKGPHSYRYGYDTGHGYNRQFRYEERDGYGYVKGRYGFFDKYGKLQVVNYSADPEKGFHAEGAHVPHHQ